MTGRRDGPIKIANELFHRPILRARDFANRAAVVLMGADSYRLAQNLRAHVMCMRDEMHAHPWSDWLILPSNVARVTPESEAEKEDRAQSNAEGQS
ncbi:MAG: hypothetical protein WB992_05570 [Bryobacteraceae bacterium]